MSDKSSHKDESKVETTVTLFVPSETSPATEYRTIKNPLRVKIHEHLLQVVYVEAGKLYDFKTSLPYLIISAKDAPKDLQKELAQREVLEAA